ncbi:ribonuclease E/G [Algirhabdus cladophorae]|uniref:ribonuclease E/G n=1 Tax=Algirhabdus cladophorae TaxID=3377108 RepID=UPI003B846988
MKGSLILLDHINGREAAARLVAGKLDDLVVDSPDRPRIGAIHLVKAERQMKGQGGIFVKSDQPFFLRQAKNIKPGDALPVQVVSLAEAGKAPPVTTKIVFKSRYVIVTPSAPGINIARVIRDEDERDRLLVLARELLQDLDYGVILRTACAGAEDDAIAQDLEAMIDEAQRVMQAAEGGQPGQLSAGDGPHITAWRDWDAADDVITQSGCFEDYGVLDQIDALDTPRAVMGGADVFIEPTRALVAVDVNTGGDTSFAAGLKANLSVARGLPRHLRLRGLGGQVVIDFAPMSKNDRKQVQSALQAAFKADPIETSLVGWTPLGLFELQRKRERLPLHGVIS